MRRVLTTKGLKQSLIQRSLVTSTSVSDNEVGLAQLKQAYRIHGHRLADVDPLGIWQRESVDSIKSLRPDTYGLTVHADVSDMESAYCGTLSLQTNLCPEDQQEWLFEKMENPSEITDSERKYACELMVVAQEFDLFLQTKFPTLKRYGGEGAEAMMPLIEEMWNQLARHGVEEAVLGQAHRGRNNLMVTMMDLPAALMFRKIKGMSEFPEGTPDYYTGDVLSHLTSSTDRTFKDGSSLHLTILPNPSHLEAVAPVACGKSYARGGYKKSCPIQIHGDGAFAGQGIVPETLQMSKIDGFNCGGSIHLVTNNQVGFSAERHKGRSSMYTTDLAVGVGLPVLRVNSNDVDACLRSARIAVEFREKFGTDILIDMMCFRKYGHNEVDDPTFTNPVLYKAVHSRGNAPDVYAEELLTKGIINQSDIDAWKKVCWDKWSQDHKDADTLIPSQRWMQGKWSGMEMPGATLNDYNTGVDAELLKQIGNASVSVQEDDFTVHPHLEKMHMGNRLKKISQNKALDWATAEAMAVGSLLHEGFDVRLCGQEAQRGTFSHRHWTLTDQNDHFRTFEPLNNLATCEEQGKVDVVSSLLSEEAVMAFEYGISIESPQRLSIWEAQFGDFFNGAQIIVDQFMTSGEAKWQQQSSMVALLPHGYDGAGPEHSSCRMERWLQMTNSSETEVDNEQTTNFHVTVPSTSAQYFHLLRRQMLRPYRKPLMVVAPKTMLRSPDASSLISEMGDNTKFQKIIPDNRMSATRIILCGGRHYFTLAKAIEEKGLSHKVELVRVEEVSPFPAVELSKQLNKYKNATEFYWCQEEPRNAGCWSFMQPRFKNILGLDLTYAGRPVLPCPAVGIGSMHKVQVESVVHDALTNL